MTARAPDRGGFPSEETLLRWVQGMSSGDDERARTAFTSLDGACRPLLLTAALPLLGDEMEAEDAVQDLLVTLWTSRAELPMRIRGTVRTYLLRSVRNRCLKAKRQDDRVVGLEAIGETETVARAERGSTAVAPETDLYTGELEERFERALGELSDARRQIILLDRRGFTPVEIGEFMGISVNAVYLLKSRARRDLGAFQDWLHDEAENA